MITTRRSVVKFMSAACAMIPLPGVVRHLAERLVPEEQTLEDAEDILRGLIMRCRNGLIDEEEARLVGAFLNRMKPDRILREKYVTYHNKKDKSVGVIDTVERQFTAESVANVPYPIRFICGIHATSDEREYATFITNIVRLKNFVFPAVIDSVKEVADKMMADLAVASRERKRTPVAARSIERLCEKAIAANPRQSVGYLVGQVVKETKGRADSQLVHATVKRLLRISA